VRENGADAFAAQLHSSVPWKDFKLEAAFRRSESKFANKPDLVKEMMGIVGQERDPIVRDQYIKTIARRLDVGESALRRTESAPARILPRDIGERFGGSRTRAPQAPSAERDLIQLLLTRPPFVAQAVKRVTPIEFEDAALAAAYEKLAENRSELEAGLNPLTLFSDDSMSDELARLTLATPPLSLADDERRLERLLSRFERRRLERRLSQVDEEIKLLLNDGASVPDTLREEFNSLAASLHGYHSFGKEG
jgi:DNA primase